MLSGGGPHLGNEGCSALLGGVGNPRKRGQGKAAARVESQCLLVLERCSLVGYVLTCLQGGHQGLGRGPTSSRAGKPGLPHVRSSLHCAVHVRLTMACGSGVPTTVCLPQGGGQAPRSLTGICLANRFAPERCQGKLGWSPVFMVTDLRSAEPSLMRSPCRAPWWGQPAAQAQA